MGNNPGSRSFAMAAPASDEGFAIFTNHDRGVALSVPIAHAVLPGEHNAFRFGMVG